MSGTSAALAGGYTMVCAMPNTNPSCVDESTLKQIEDLYAKKAVCDYGLYLGATATNSTEIVDLADRACGLKMYLNETFNALRMDKVESWIKHFQQWPKHKPICCHAEENILPAILFFAELYDRHVHICHVSTKQDMQLIKAAKEKGIKVTCEVAMHHLILTEKDMESQFEHEGMKEVRPRLKSEEDRQALWSMIDWIDMIASDHAPHTVDEKQRLKSPGFPGLETSLPLLITAYKQGKLTLEQIVQKSYTNPKRIFNLPDQPDTYIEVDLDNEWVVPSEMPYSKCKWTPFAGLKVYGQVRRVVLRGEVVYVDGQMLAKPGYGQNITAMNDSTSSETQVIKSKSLNTKFKNSQAQLNPTAELSSSVPSRILLDEPALKPNATIGSPMYQSNILGPAVTTNPALTPVTASGLNQLVPKPSRQTSLTAGRLIF